jgi:hypothetical protein
MQKNLIVLLLSFVLFGAMTCRKGPENEPKSSLDVHVRLFTVGGVPAHGAFVKLFRTEADALAGVNYFIKQSTNTMGNTVFDLDAGRYFIVATYEDQDGTVYTSDTTRVKDYHAGPPPTSQAMGPQEVMTDGIHESDIMTVIDYAE